MRIIQRLNGMNWIHRLEKTAPRLFLRSEVNNQVLAFIRRHLADGIVYQSHFCHTWWNRVYGSRPIPTRSLITGWICKNFLPTGLKLHQRITFGFCWWKGAWLALTPAGWKPP